MDSVRQIELALEAIARQQRPLPVSPVSESIYREKVNLFICNDTLYVKVKPVKMLFRSTLVHDVITRGDVFAVDVKTGELTILPGTAQIEVVPVVLEMGEKAYNAYVPF